jgi:hypothetical protein
MENALELGKYSIGTGDRFGHQAFAQLRACLLAAEEGVQITPVWNKSNREHAIIGSQPVQTRAAADAAVRQLGWKHPYHVDADHIRMETVRGFLTSSDFFTIDVADWIGQTPDTENVTAFAERHAGLVGWHDIPGIEGELEITQADLELVGAKYSRAIQEAMRTHCYISELRGNTRFITEVSMDETDEPQTPPELLVILAALAEEQVPVQTIAPKFSGRFNKGVDYRGDVAQFEQEFNHDLAVIAYAIGRFGLPKNLKISVHSGSDKFSLYGPIRRGLEQFGAGVHLKTSGTTWLEEVIGLAEGGGTALKLVQAICAEALERIEELSKPYATVIDIDPACLPNPAEVGGWTSEQMVRALRHDPNDPLFNPDLRQLIHIGYKLAAEKGVRFTHALRENAVGIGANVTRNLWDRHIQPLFGRP